MKVSRQQHKFLKKMLVHWQEENLLNEHQCTELLDSTTIRGFDWQGLARYAFFGALFCILLSLAAVLLDKQLIALINNIFSAPALAKSVFFSVLAALILTGGLYFRKRHPLRTFSHESTFFLAVVSIASAIAYLGEAIDTGSGHFSILLLIACLTYCILGLLLPSKLVWLFGLFSSGAWFLAETGYITGWNAYFYGMNYPLRFALFGGTLFLCSYLMLNWQRIASFATMTQVTGLLFFFISFWVLSITGNHDSIDSWYEVKQYELWHWSALLALASIVAIFIGLKYDDDALRGFGISFLFINLYTRYVEYGWEHMHQAIFFGLLAISFWLLGRYAEKLWLLGR